MLSEQMFRVNLHDLIFLSTQFTVYALEINVSKKKYNILDQTNFDETKTYYLGNIKMYLFLRIIQWQTLKHLTINITEKTSMSFLY